MTESIQVGSATVPAQWHQHSAYPERIIISGSCVYTVHDVTSADGNSNPDVVRLMAAAPELLVALKDLVYTTEAMSAYIPPHNAKIREEYVTRTHRAWQCIRKAEGRGE